MVLQARYIVDEVDSNGDVVRSDTFTTQRALVAALPHAFTPASIREVFRTQQRVKYGELANKAKYRQYRVRRYPR